MLQYTKYMLAFNTFKSRNCFNTLFTNSAFKDKKSDVEKYIIDVKQKFKNNFDTESKGKIIKNSVPSKKNKYLGIKYKIYEKDDFEELYNRMYFTGNLKDVIDEETQTKIDALLTQRLTYGAKSAILDSINNNKIPTFKSLIRCSSALASLGDVFTIKLIQNTVQQNYKYLAEKENNLEHYLCEALFRSGNHFEALHYLATLVENCNNFKRVKETACYLIRMISEFSEDHQRRVYEITDKFILLKNENKPAAVFLEFSFLTKSQHLHKLAELLLEKHPELLQKREEIISNIVNKASTQNDYGILQNLIEVLVKYGTKESLSLTLSTQLKLYCYLENVSKSKELVSYAKEKHIYLSADSVKKFFILLGKTKQGTSLNSLMIKYGFKEPL